MGKFLALMICGMIMLGWFLTRTLTGAMFLAMISNKILS